MLKRCAPSFLMYAYFKQQKYFFVSTLCSYFIICSELCCRLFRKVIQLNKMPVIHVMKMQIQLTYSGADPTATFWNSLRNAVSFRSFYINCLEKVVVINTIYTNM